MHTIPGITKAEQLALGHLSPAAWVRIVSYARSNIKSLSKVKGNIAEELIEHHPEYPRIFGRARDQAVKEGIPPDSIKFVRDVRAIAPKTETVGGPASVGDGMIVAIRPKEDSNGKPGEVEEAYILAIFESKSPGTIHGLVRDPKDSKDSLGQIRKDFERLTLEGETISIEGQPFSSENVKVSKHFTQWVVVLPPGKEVSLEDLKGDVPALQIIYGEVRDSVLNVVAARLLELIHSGKLPNS